jgi:hypothetical protein
MFRCFLLLSFAMTAAACGGETSAEDGEREDAPSPQVTDDESDDESKEEGLPAIVDSMHLQATCKSCKSSSKYYAR